MKFLIAILFLLSSTYCFAQTGEIRGVTSEDETKITIPFSKIKVYKNNELIQEAVSDSSGNFRITDMMPDTVNVSCEDKFHFKKVVKGVIVTADHTSFVDFHLKSIDAKK